MPSQNTVDQFIALVVSGAHDDAIEAFYAEGATMQENGAPPREGRAQLLAHERGMLARARTVHTTCIAPVLVQGDHVAIRWIFEFLWKDGRRTRLEEIAWQRWEGEKIAQETFFYDPAQLTAAAGDPRLG